MNLANFPTHICRCLAKNDREWPRCVRLGTFSKGGNFGDFEPAIPLQDHTNQPPPALEQGSEHFNIFSDNMHMDGGCICELSFVMSTAKTNFLFSL